MFEATFKQSPRPLSFLVAYRHPVYKRAVDAHVPSLNCLPSSTTLYFISTENSSSSKMLFSHLSIAALCCACAGAMALPINVAQSKQQRDLQLEGRAVIPDGVSAAALVGSTKTKLQARSTNEEIERLVRAKAEYERLRQAAEAKAKVGLTRTKGEAEELLRAMTRYDKLRRQAMARAARAREQRESHPEREREPNADMDERMTEEKRRIIRAWFNRERARRRIRPGPEEGGTTNPAVLSTGQAQRQQAWAPPFKLPDWNPRKLAEWAPAAAAPAAVAGAGTLGWATARNLVNAVPRVVPVVVGGGRDAF